MKYFTLEAYQVKFEYCSLKLRQARASQGSAACSEFAEVSSQPCLPVLLRASSRGANQGVSAALKDHTAAAGSSSSGACSAGAAVGGRSTCSSAACSAALAAASANITHKFASSWLLLSCKFGQQNGRHYTSAQARVQQEVAHRFNKQAVEEDNLGVAAPNTADSTVFSAALTFSSCLSSGSSTPASSAYLCRCSSCT